MDFETHYLLRRASEEAKSAIMSDQPQVADVHEALSVCYTAKAVTLLAAEDEDGEPARMFVPTPAA